MFRRALQDVWLEFTSVDTQLFCLGICELCENTALNTHMPVQFYLDLSDTVWHDRPLSSVIGLASQVKPR